MIIRLFALLFFLALPINLFLTARQASEQGRESAQKLYNIEVHTLSGNDTAKGEVDLLFRIPYDFFIFTRNTTGNISFKGEAEITVELLSKENISIFRKILQRELSSITSETEQLNRIYLQEAVAASVSPGTYKVRFDVTDRQSARQISDQSLSVTVPYYRTLTIFDVMFAEGTSSDSLYVPVNRSGNIPFGRNIVAIANVQSPGPPGTLLPAVTITRLDRSPARQKQIIADSGAAALPVFPKRLSRSLTDSLLAYTAVPAADGRSALVIFPLRGDTLDQGEYELTLSVNSGSQRASIHRPFSVVWIDKPWSLRNRKTAVDLLEYLMPPDEFKKISRAGDEEQDQLFREFWKRRDPTPRTSWNELTDEYYRRADYTMTHFSTFRRQNGARTDRGKIYLLNGPPSSEQRRLTPGRPPQEIWDYESLHKQFIFQDESRQGEYKLIEEHETQQ